MSHVPHDAVEELLGRRVSGKKVRLIDQEQLAARTVGHSPIRPVKDVGQVERQLVVRYPFEVDRYYGLGGTGRGQSVQRPERTGTEHIQQGHEPGRRTPSLDYPVVKVGERGHLRSPRVQLGYGRVQLGDLLVPKTREKSANHRADSRGLLSPIAPRRHRVERIESASDPIRDSDDGAS